MNESKEPKETSVVLVRLSESAQDDPEPVWDQIEGLGAKLLGPENECYAFANVANDSFEALSAIIGVVQVQPQRTVQDPPIIPQTCFVGSEFAWYMGDLGLDDVRGHELFWDFNSRVIEVAKLRNHPIMAVYDSVPYLVAPDMDEDALHQAHFESMMRKEHTWVRRDGESLMELRDRARSDVVRYSGKRTEVSMKIVWQHDGSSESVVFHVEYDNIYSAWRGRLRNAIWANAKAKAKGRGW